MRTSTPICRVFLSLVILCVLGGCSSTNQERAKEQARADLDKASREAKQAGREIKKDAQDLSRRVDASVQPDSESASEKLAHAEERAKRAASSAGVQLDRAALLAKIKTRLASSAGMSTLTNVDVSVHGSVVTLDGTVGNLDQKREAETAVTQVDGVSKVENHLTVQP